ncbi:MAG: AAA family ATPase [Burkholderiaceae bacterium]
MRLARLRLLAFGPFTGRELSFDRGPRDLHLIFGENEAGKSSALSAITDLRFGIPQQSVHDFIHPYARMRIGATVQWPDGASIDVLRRKGRGATLTLADEHGEDTGEPVDADLLEALTGGLERERYEREFGIDHERLREGGRHLLRGGGELGATLFEASSGVADVNAVLERLETRARELFVPDARAKKGGSMRRSTPCAMPGARSTRRPLARPNGRDSSAARGAREDLEAHASELARVNQRLRELEGLRARLPLLASLDALSAERAAIGPVALLGPDAHSAGATPRASATVLESALPRSSANRLRLGICWRARMSTIACWRRPQRSIACMRGFPRREPVPSESHVGRRLWRASMRGARR